MIAGVSAVIDLVFLGFLAEDAHQTALTASSFDVEWFLDQRREPHCSNDRGREHQLHQPGFGHQDYFRFCRSGDFFVVIRKKVFGDPNMDQALLSMSAKGLAFASLFCWLGAITAGRLLAYLGPVSEWVTSPTRLPPEFYGMDSASSGLSAKVELHRFCGLRRRILV